MTYGSGNSGDYKKLKGQMIQVVDTDPVAYAGSWASSTATNSAREECGAGGTATSAIVFGGYKLVQLMAVELQKTILGIALKQIERAV